MVAVRESLLAGKTAIDLIGQIIPLLAIGLISIPLGLRVFVTAERHAKRTGRLKRNG